MIPMTLDEIGRVVGGTLADANGATTVTGAAFLDSRHAEPGGLFVAVAGERVDGHEYAAAAVASGAAAVLGARPTGVPTVVVTDPLAALAELARHLIDSLPDLTVLALTGSQGKTGTKDYLAQILAAAGPTAATVGNLNNEIGVPLTVLTARRDTRFLVVEMGARGIGHIAFLCKIAPPQIGAVLNVGTAHLSEFGSREAIARAKREILEGLPAEGVAVVNADNEFTAAMAGRGPASTMTFGEALGSDVTWRDVSYDDLGRPTAEFDIAGERARISLTQAGEHQLHNAAAAAAMAHAAGVGVATIRHALEEATSLSRWRMELDELADGTVVVNDAYNANPASMDAAISVATAISTRRGSRSIAILGEMKELGESSEVAHVGVGEAAARAGVDVLIAVGEAAAVMLEGAAHVTDWLGTAVSVRDRDSALAWLHANQLAGDVVLVKASRAAELEWVAQNLIDPKNLTDPEEQRE